MTYSQRKKHAEALVAQDNYPDAKKEYELLFKENPKDEDNIRMMRFLFHRIQEGNYSFLPETPAQFAMRGVSRFYRMEFKEALEDLTTALKNQPRNDDALQIRAHTYKLLERYEEAIIDLKTAIDINPKGEYYDLLAEVYSDMNDIDTALPLYKKATEASPDDPRIWYNYGFELAESGQVEEGLRMLDKALEVFPGYENAVAYKRLLLSGKTL